MLKLETNIIQFKQKLHNQCYDFEQMSMEAFELNYKHNPVYQQFCNHIKKKPTTTKSLLEIPFMPIEFFKSHKISIHTKKETDIFTSSGTTSSNTSKHYVYDVNFYLQNCKTIFENTYNSLEESVFLFLLPSYLERNGSSLIAMAQFFIEESNDAHSGFYLNDYTALANKINGLEHSKKNIFLIGVSFGILDFLETNPSINHKNFTIMETGGMKGRRKELTRNELHHQFDSFFGHSLYHSEYGMTELFSQAYSKGNGIFEQNNVLKIFIRDLKDPLDIYTEGTGALNVIDLANIESVCFIGTSDQGKVSKNQFEILGRIDNSDIRGCNLMLGAM